MVRRRTRRARIGAALVATAASLVLITGMAPVFAAGAAPVVTSVDPAVGSMGGGTVVEITGTGLAGVTGVTFGGTPGTALDVHSDTALSVTTPAHATAESVTVVVTSADGSASVPGGFKYSCVATPGSFLIDGAPPAGCDFPSVDDGFDDSTWFTRGSAENIDPSSWSLTGSSNAGKADIGQMWGVSQVVGGDVMSYFGFTNKSTSGGTQNYSLEYNQADPVNGRPVRTPGDLLFAFSSTGSDPLKYEASYIYTAGAPSGCTPISGSSPSGSWCPFALPSGAWTPATSANGLYAEASINISKLFDTSGCSGTFGTMSLRSDPGTYWTSAMKDYVKPLGVNTPSTCATIVIKKFRAGTDQLLTGAHFDVYQGAAATGTPLLSDVTDGGSHDTDSVAGQITLGGIDPGTYTVEETQAPPGYFLPANPVQTVDVGVSSTIEFDFYDLKKWLPLTASKVVDSATYDVEYAWDVDKKVAGNGSGPWLDSLTKDVADDGDGPTGYLFHYQVTAKAVGTPKTSNIKVTGSIKVNNPNDENVTAQLSDKLSDNTACTITGGSTQTAVPGPNSYPYTCSYADGTKITDFSGVTTNNASVTWDRSTYPQTEADITADGNYPALTPSKSFAWSIGTEKYKTATITDDKHPVWSPEYADPWTMTWAPGATETREYTRLVSAAAGQTNTETNTATVTSQGDVLDHEDAVATVRVGKNLSVSKVSMQSGTRTYLWKVDKANTDKDHRVYVNPQTGTATTHWDITLSANGKHDTGLVMTGTITVTNPNNWEDVVITGLTDSYEGNTCVVNGLDTVAGRTIPKSGTKDFSYTCNLPDDTTLTGTNTAKVSWDPAAAHTPTTPEVSAGKAAYDLLVPESKWDLTKVNEQVQLWDDVLGYGGGAVELPGGPYTWSENFSTTIPFTAELPAAAGDCTDYTNQASVRGANSAVLDTGDAGVTVCNPVQLTLAKDASGKFDRTYHWGLDKFVSADSQGTPSQTSATWGGDSYSHPFGYRVVLRQLMPTDDLFTIDGTITVHNPNTDLTIPAVSTTLTDAPNVGADATCRIDDSTMGADDGKALTGYTTPKIASTDTLSFHYLCVLTGTPTQDNAQGAVPSYAKGSNVLTGTNASNSPVTTPVTFTKVGEIDKTVHVFDDKVTHTDTPVELGQGVSYNESDPDATYHWDYTLTHTATAARCQDFTNHAAVFGHSSTALDTAQATATVCPTTGTWTVAKTSSADGPVPVGSAITYTLKAHKTSAVKPTNVVLVDDLSDLAPHAALPSLSELQAAAPAGTTVALAGDVITWTIPELDADQALAFTVTVDDDAYGVDLPNLVTSAGSTNCPDAQTAATVEECNTDSDTPHYTLTKSSAPGQDATVAPGDVITYTLTVTNDSDADLNSTTMPGATVTDDLGNVLDDATFVAGSIDPAGQASVSGTKLTWTLPAIEAGKNAVLTYQVKVNSNEWGATLTNVATPGSGGDCVGACSTTQYTPHWTLTKTSDPASGSTVAPGDDITYTLSVHNDGPVTVSGASVTDDLSDVVDDATLQMPLAAGLSQADATTLSWAVPDVAPGATVTVSYTVSMDAGAWGATVKNLASPDQPSGDCEGTCSTTEYSPHWTLTKTSDPASGSTVAPGDDITYTLSVHNDGPVPVSGATVTDDLSDVVDDATLQQPLDSALTPAPDGMSLEWAVPDVAPGATVTVSYTVTMNDDAWGATVKNLASPDQPSGECVESCTTTEYSPHWTLTKTSDPADGTVMPPYLGDPGDTVTYTLTAHNDGPIPVSGATAVDDLSDVLDDATLVTPLDEALDLSGNELTWSIPTMQPGDTTTVTYQVRVNADRWDQTLTNVVTPGGPSGECVESCTTTTDTPPATRMQVKKVNAETGAGLAGAEFALYEDNAPLADPSDPVVGPEDTEVGTATSGGDGMAQFTPWLRPGTFLVKETAAPDGYALPVAGDTMVRVVDGSNFVAGDYMSAFEFRDPAQGELGLVKEQFEKDPATGLWLPSDGVVDYGDELKYVVKVTGAGPKLFHDVTVTDYVPGYNPDDTTSTAKAALVPGSATCTGGFTCTVTVGADGLVTWQIGTLSDASGSAEMVVTFPELPSNAAYQNGRFETSIWNVGYLAWTEMRFVPGQEQTLVPHELTSNEVVAKATAFEVLPPVVKPPVVKPPTVTPPAVTPPKVLPNTGGPAAWLPLTGIGLLALGAVLVVSRERRRRREA